MEDKHTTRSIKTKAKTNRSNKKQEFNKAEKIGKETICDLHLCFLVITLVLKSM